MNKKEISEIKKQFTPENCSITRICGCYVDGEKNKKTELKEAFLSLSEEEMFKYFEIFRKFLLAFDVIRRHGVVRKGIVAAAVRGKLLHRAALRQVEHFVLQIVRDARRDVIFLPVQRKIAVIRAEIHG